MIGKYIQEEFFQLTVWLICVYDMYLIKSSMAIMVFRILLVIQGN